MKYNFYYGIAIIQAIFGLYHSSCNEIEMSKFSLIACGVFWLFGILKEIHNAILELKK